MGDSSPAKVDRKNIDIEMDEIEHRGRQSPNANGTSSREPLDEDDLASSKRHVHQTPSIMSVAFRDLSVHAFGRKTDYQRTMSNFIPASLVMGANWLMRKPDFRIDILHELDGLVQSGEMLLVLGNPGSGCTTLLKTLSGQTHDLHIDDESSINYQGVSAKQMFTEFRGKGTYQAEFDIHFPTLTMRETLELASKARSSPKYWYACPTAVESEARTLGLSAALDTQMGNALMPGVSGGERKRATIAEILLGDSFLQCWDNSTRGLDSVNALDFIRAVRKRTTASGSVAIVTLYQAGEEIYNLFDKVMVLHEGHQIYFGPTKEAMKYFTNMGFVVPPRSATPEFLTSVTRPLGLRPTTRQGFGWAPKTAKQFSEAWKSSPEYTEVLTAIDTYTVANPIGDKENLTTMRTELKGSEKKKSAYILPVHMQISILVKRAFLRLRHNLAAPISTIIGNLVTSLILGSMFFNLSNETDSFFGRGVLLFFTSLVNTTLAAFESVALWDDRPVIEKHSQYGFYHPFTEAVASWICDLPTKVVLTFVFNFPLYFLSNLRRTPGAFFTYYLFGFMSLLNGSVIYRCMGATSRTLAGSQPIGALLVMLLTVYSGFVVPFRDMRPWLQWFAYINPVYYAFEAMTINEFSGRRFKCAEFIPPGGQDSGEPFICNAPGAKEGEMDVSGDDYIREEFGFVASNLWRDLGILFAILGIAAATYVLATEYITMLPPRSDVLLFQQGHMPVASERKTDEETGRRSVSREDELQINRKKSDLDMMGRQSHGTHLLWSNLTYEVKEGKKWKTILHQIDGWVKPGTLTALMGPSGAGKTTLLDVLAERTSVGVVTGNIVVDTRYQNIGFARKIGYAQQDDIHMSTVSVREALEFSAVLRQPSHYSEAEKLAYVDHVIDVLDMNAFQHAVVGRLNIEQKKRVTIGTELAARPELLLFLDEPTSGLDSDSSWSFCTLLRRLADSGQPILCTIHQPSSPLLGLFDQLLFLNKGSTMYFGELGSGFRTLINYFEGHGARKCLPHENAAEWMMEIANDGAAQDDSRWGAIWRGSSEAMAVREECERLKNRLSRALSDGESTSSDAGRPTEFATSFWTQLITVTKRAFLHDWRSPTYLYSKTLTTFGCAFINGVSFWDSGNSSQDMQNQIFSLFLLLTIFGTHVQLIMERFYQSRVLYENRERQSRTYSWVVFIFSNVAVEFVSQSIISIIAYASWYYPLGLWRKAEAQGELNSRSVLVFLLIWSLLILFQTLSQMLMTVMPNIPTGINIGNLLFMLSLIFSGVLVSPNDMPKFWLFMYRATPLSHYVDAIVGTSLSGIDVQCSKFDRLELDPPSGQTCDEFLGGLGQFTIENPSSTSNCRVCPYTTSDKLLEFFDIRYSDRWWEFGVTMAYNLINVGLTLLLYWLARVPKGAKMETPQMEDSKKVKRRDDHKKSDSGHSQRSLTRPISDRIG